MLNTKVLDHPAPPAPHDISLRVGCSLIYDTTAPVVLLLNLRPMPGASHEVIEERFTFGPTESADAYIDSHGNGVQRLHLPKGRTEIRHDAVIHTTSRPDNHNFTACEPIPPAKLPPELFRYTLPSRYCDSDKLANFAWQQFGHIEHGIRRVEAISAWVHHNIEYRYGSGRPDLSAWDVLMRRHGVCRDFAHLFIALCRTFNLPARYVTGHLPDITVPDPENHMDFHAYAEVYLGNNWWTFDARFHQRRIGRVKISHGLDAVDGAFSMFYGSATLAYFQVWAYQFPRGTVHVGDPLDFTRRIDNTFALRTDPVG